jgi:Domain of unknown function (DUF6438)
VRCLSGYVANTALRSGRPRRVASKGRDAVREGRATMSVRRGLWIAVASLAALLTSIAEAGVVPAPPPASRSRPQAVAGLAPLSSEELAGVVIMMERQACYGTCPIYTVEIRGDGKVSYNGSQFVQVAGPQSTTVEPEKVREIVAEFAAAHFGSLRDRYSGKACDDRRKCPSGFFYDAPSALLKLTVRGETHALEHNFGCSCAPRALFRIEQHIDELAGTRRWVGDNPGGQSAGTSN